MGQGQGQWPSENGLGLAWPLDNVGATESGHGDSQV